MDWRKLRPEHPHDHLHWFLDANIIHDKDSGREFLNMSFFEFERRLRETILRDQREDTERRVDRLLKPSGEV